MTTGMQALLSHVLLIAGGFFVLVGTVGLVRMPNFFTRLHAAGVTDTLGVGLVLLGLVVIAGLELQSLKLLLILAFILLTGPTATHALAKAALHGGMRPAKDAYNGEAR